MAKPAEKQAFDSDTEVSCTILFIPSSLSPKVVVVTGVLGDTITPLCGTVVLVNKVTPSWLVLLGSQVSLMNTHHWTHREVSCFRQLLALPKYGFENSCEESFLQGISVFCRALVKLSWHGGVNFDLGLWVEWL